MRALRRSIDDQDVRSARIWAGVRSLPAVQEASAVMAYASVPGEPDSEPFIDWCRDERKTVVVPASDPAAAMPDEPASIDVVIVPGVAFTRRGDRLGQGGGWYDRFLADVRSDCLTIGVAFVEQLVDDLPVEPHDVRLDLVVTDEDVAAPTHASGD